MRGSHPRNRLAVMPHYAELSNLTLITGGARSGKSMLAEQLAAHWENVIYIATMEPWSGDKEGQERINRHQSRRPKHWQTVESPYCVDATIEQLTPENTSTCVILDCVSVYLSNILLRGLAHSENPYDCEGAVTASMTSLLNAIELRQELHFIIVTNEVGSGIVPETPVARAFRDFLGTTNQLFASRAGTVWLTCSGLKIRLKPGS